MIVFVPSEHADRGLVEGDSGHPGGATSTHIYDPKTTLFLIISTKKGSSC